MPDIDKVAEIASEMRQRGCSEDEIKTVVQLTYCNCCFERDWSQNEDDDRN